MIDSLINLQQVDLKTRPWELDSGQFCYFRDFFVVNGHAFISTYQLNSPARFVLEVIESFMQLYR